MKPIFQFTTTTLCIGVLTSLLGVHAAVLAQTPGELSQVVKAESPKATTPAQPLQIHKCRTSDGRLLYQDFPCRGAETLPTPELDPARAGVTPTPIEIQQQRAATSSGEIVKLKDPESAPVLQRAAPSVALPTYFECVRYTGESRITETPDTTMRLVPQSVIDAPDTVVEDFVRLEADPNAAPETVAADMAWVQDRCRPLGLLETCRHLKQRQDQVRSDLRKAFQDTFNDLSAERNRLETIIGDHCTM